MTRSKPSYLESSPNSTEKSRQTGKMYYNFFPGSGRKVITDITCHVGKSSGTVERINGSKKYTALKDSYRVAKYKFSERQVIGLLRRSKRLNKTSNEERLEEEFSENPRPKRSNSNRLVNNVQCHAIDRSQSEQRVSVSHFEKNLSITHSSTHNYENQTLNTRGTRSRNNRLRNTRLSEFQTSDPIEECMDKTGKDTTKKQGIIPDHNSSDGNRAYLVLAEERAIKIEDDYLRPRKIRKPSQIVHPTKSPETWPFQENQNNPEPIPGTKVDQSLLSVISARHQRLEDRNRDRAKNRQMSSMPFISEKPESSTNSLEVSTLKTAKIPPHAKVNDKCSRDVITNSRIEKPIRKSRTESHEEHLCLVCSKVCLTEVSFQRHSKTHVPKNHECKRCGKRVATSRSLQDHMKAHMKEKLTCDTCGKELLSFKSLELHMKVHSEERPYECQVCSKTFRFKGNLGQHLSIHVGEKFKCTVCSKLLATKRNLEDHMRLHTGKLFSCGICLQTLASLGSLNVHMKKHGSEKPFKCPHCGKRFLYKAVCAKHVISHQEVMAFQCRFCNKKLKYKTSLETHEKTHKERKKYRCENCSCEYSTKQTLARHMKRFH